MKLYYKGTDDEVQKDDILKDFHGEKWFAYYWKEPDHGVGKICVKRNKDDIHCLEYYVTVFDLEWR